MKNINIILLTSLLFGLLLISGCEDDVLPVNTHDDAYVDVIVKQVNNSGSAKYKRMFFAGGADISPAGSTVTSPDGKEYELTKYWAGDGIVTNGKDPLSDSKPSAGEYIFKLKFNDGYIKELKDDISDVNVGLVTGLSIIHEAGSSKIEITWDSVQNADLICTKFTEIDIAGTKPFFKTNLAKDKTSYTYTTTTSAMPGWLRSPDDLVRGTEYWVVVAGKKVEAGTTVSGVSKDFEFNSCTKKKIVW